MAGGENVIAFSHDGITWDLHNWEAVGDNDTSTSIGKENTSDMSEARGLGKME